MNFTDSCQNLDGLWSQFLDAQETFKKANTAHRKAMEDKLKELEKKGVLSKNRFTGTYESNKCAFWIKLTNSHLGCDDTLNKGVLKRDNYWYCVLPKFCSKTKNDSSWANLESIVKNPQKFSSLFLMAPSEYQDFISDATDIYKTLIA